MSEGDRRQRVIGSTPRLTRDEIVNQAFPQAFRGLADASVRAFLRRVADEYEALRAGQEELFAEIDRLEAQLGQPQAVVSEEQDLLSIVGEETARVLRSAKESAEEIRRNAEERATDLLREAHEEARAIREQAEAVVAERTRETEEGAAELLREAERLARELQEGAEAKVAEFEAQAEADARAEIDSARRRSRELVAEAQSARERTLSELGRRREALETQLEMLRAGRDRLVEAYRVVKVTLDEATDALRVVDSRGAPEAKAARITSAALPPPHSIMKEEHEVEAATAPSPAAPGVEPALEPEVEPEVNPEVEPEIASEMEPAPEGTGPQPRVTAFALGELETPIVPSEPAGGPRPAPPLERYRVEQPSGVRVLRSDPGAAVPEAPSAPLDEDPAPSPAVPAPSVPAEPPHAEPPRREDIQEIFARLRAGREESAAPPAEAPESTVDSEPSVPAEEGEEATPDTARPPAELSVEANVRRRRHEAIEPLVDHLVRAVKRVVRDEQNVVLEAVRRHRGIPSADHVLPSVDEQDEAFVAAAADLLNEACAAGEAAARDLGAVDGINGDVGRRRARARELAAALARQLMDPLRGKLGDTLEEAAAAGEQGGDPGERVRARYRDWKGQRVDVACGDSLSMAFSRGLYDAVPEGITLRWMTTDPSPCPDCADNALEHTPRGSAFPTGHVAPPAHPGCHCLVFPADVAAGIEVVERH